MSRASRHNIARQASSVITVSVGETDRQTDRDRDRDMELELENFNRLGP